MTRFYRSHIDKKIAGVCGGLAELQGVDPTWVRLIMVGMTLCTGVFPCVIAYLITWMIVPVKNEYYPAA